MRIWKVMSAFAASAILLTACHDGPMTDGGEAVRDDVPMFHHAETYIYRSPDSTLVLVGRALSNAVDPTQEDQLLADRIIVRSLIHHNSPELPAHLERMEAHSPERAAWALYFRSLMHLEEVSDGSLQRADSLLAILRERHGADSLLTAHVTLASMQVLARRKDAVGCDPLFDIVSERLTQDSLLLAKARSIQGMAQLDGGDPVLALLMQHQAIALAEPHGATHELASAWLGAGFAHADQADYADAAIAFARADSLFAQIGSARDRITALDGLAYCNWGILDPVLVIDQWNTALRMADSLGEDRKGATVHLNIARFLIGLDPTSAAAIAVPFEHRFDPAQEHIDEAREVATRSGDIALLGKVIKVQSAILNRQGRFEGSIAMTNEAMPIFERAADHQWVCAALVDIASNQIALAHWHAAGNTLQRALAIAERYKLNQQRSSIYYRLYFVRKQQKQFPEALAWHERHEALKDSLEGLDVVEKLAQRELRSRFAQRIHADSLAHEQQLETERWDAHHRLAQQGERSRALLVIGAILLLGVGGSYLVDRHRRRERFARRAAELENKALRAQMDPHFIGNTLHAVNSFLLTHDSASASKLLSRFAKWIRLMLERGRQEEVSLKDDIEAMRLYLELEQLRTRDKFTFSIAVDPALPVETIRIPPMLLQPVLENAIQHGIGPKAGTGSITLSAAAHEGDLLIRIVDDGVGRRKKSPDTVDEDLPRSSLSTSITLERLHLLEKRTGRPARMSFIDLEGGTSVEVRIPLFMTRVNGKGT